ncbi:MAG: hypothetical protein ACFFCH_00415 [Promethearchaeota archaeon]
MTELGKLDVVCLGFMTVIVLTISGYLALFGGWALVDGMLIWMGWVWWVIFAVVIASLLIIIMTSRRNIDESESTYKNPQE